MVKQFVPCLVCDPELRRDPEIGFLHPAHHQTHDRGLPYDHDSYLKWVAEEYDLDRDHRVFEPGGLTIPSEFEKFEHLFDQSG